MAEKSFPLENTEYTAQDAQLWFATRTSGVYTNGHFSVSASGSMDVTLGKGIAWLNYAEFAGCVYANTDDLVLTVPLSNGSMNRIDRLCIRMEILEQKCYAYIKQGTAARTPTAPSLQRDNVAYEISIAQIYVGTGVTAINAGNITDERLNSDVCGLMRDGVTGIDTSMLEAQLAESLGNLSADLQTFYEEQQDVFTEWFAGIQNILNGDVAATLTSKVTVLENKASQLEAKTSQLESKSEDKIEGTARTVTLSSSGWSSSAPYTQTVNVQGVTASTSGYAAPADASFEEYSKCMVRISAQGSGTVTFKASKKPSAALTINMIILEGVTA
ncbi:MAG: hypothetical protein PUD16_04565 [bacterium]|nr:hypothetical protein [bacterium]